MTPVRVVYVQQDGLVTGSAISLSLLLRHLDRKRFLPRVVMAREGPARGLFEPLGVEVDVVPFDCFWTSPVPGFLEGDYYRNFRGLLPNHGVREYLVRVRPDLVHVNDKAALVAGRSAKRAGIPVVWHLRSGYAGRDRWIQPGLSARSIRASADALIAISEDETGGLETFEDVSVIHNGVDLEAASRAESIRGAKREELGIPPDTLAIGTVGQLTREKGAWNFIRAMKIVRGRLPARRLLFFVVASLPPRKEVGKGWRARLGFPTESVEKRLGRELTSAELGSDLRLTGHRSDVLGVMAAMDIVTAVYELPAIGRPAFEAMAVGRAVIANRGRSGRSDVVTDGENGILVPAGSPEALAGAACNLVEDVGARERLGQAGREHARRQFDPEVNVRQVEAIYERVSRRKIMTGRR